MYVVIIIVQDFSTPIIAASKGGHSEVVKMLLSEGANVNDKERVCYSTHFVLYIN